MQRDGLAVVATQAVVWGTSDLGANMSAENMLRNELAVARELVGA